MEIAVRFRFEPDKNAVVRRILDDWIGEFILSVFLARVYDDWTV